MTEKNNIPEIIGELKKLSNTEIKKRIDNYLVWQNFGNDFIKQLGINAFLDNLTNPDKKLNVISNYCDKILVYEFHNKKIQGQIINNDFKL